MTAILEQKTASAEVDAKRNCWSKALRLATKCLVESNQFILRRFFQRWPDGLARELLRQALSEGPF